MPPDQKRDYAVGYGKPPRRTRFPKGQSGNPRGRSPAAKNLKTLLSNALNEFVIVTENGGHRKITKREAIITQLVNRSVSRFSPPLPATSGLAASKTATGSSTPRRRRRRCSAPRCDSGIERVPGKRVGRRI